MRYEWTPELSVGVDAIDDQHRELFDALNMLSDALRASSAAEGTGRALRFLQKHVSEHFMLEENLMRELRYPAIAEHMKQHRELLARTDALIAQQASHGLTPALALSVRDTMAVWFVKHIEGFDRALARFAQRASSPSGPR